jgi:hypothetical protein
LAIATVRQCSVRRAHFVHAAIWRLNERRSIMRFGNSADTSNNREVLLQPDFRR